ncbi:MAG: hypothetical protein U0800_26200 [Isosphaeraceae bacterium]
MVDAQGAVPWPRWACRLASIALVWHMGSQLAAQLAAQPASRLETAAAGVFLPYFEFLNVGHSYRYYAPEPGPTPIVLARLRYSDGREEEIRLPDRGLTPRLRYQRHLNLANHLYNDFLQSRAREQDHDHPPGAPPHSHEQGPGRWAASYAHHLSRSHPGCETIALYATRHLLPDLEEVAARGIPEADDERFYEVPVLIGEFACADFGS